MRQATLELQRVFVQKAMQTKADTVDECCLICQTQLTHRQRGVAKTINAFCGPLKLSRTHGWCKGCEQWVFPADQALGLHAHSTASPLVQEMCALLVSKMPCEQAEALTERVAGIKISRSTLAREAQRQGERAIHQRERLPAQPTKAPLSQQPEKPFTLVIEIDAWNVRERDQWGKTKAACRKDPKFSRWHWVYTATCFRLDHRVVKGKRRALITERSYVATRQGIDAMMGQLHVEAMQRGLARAERVLVVADGAVWIWNLAADRFSEAEQRLDLYHANAYLWAVANQIHPDDPKAARCWVKPLLKPLRADKVDRVITTLEQLQPSLQQAAAKAAGQTIHYYRSNKERMKYTAGHRRGEPLGSGTIESTCRQLQCRMKRCGQFWSTSGDEAILCLEMFWRNQRWEHLFPHITATRDFSRN